MVRLLAILLFLSNAVLAADDPVSWDREHKREYAAGVAERLASAMGEARGAPALRISKKVNVAVFWPGSGPIELDERAFDLCARSADGLETSLAVLLGHELAHFYGNHGWLGEFGNELPPGEFAEKLKQLAESERLRVETEADYFGAFLGYLAGYDTPGVAPRLLESIYAKYDKMPGYPTLAQRKELNRGAEEKLGQLVPVFEAGLVLMLLREYESAGQCFDRISRDFPSREILNNAGVARALAAAMLSTERESRFAYPFEMDADTRLRRPEVVGRGSDPAMQARRAKLLAEARARFESARNRDEGYATAYVNLAGVYEMEQERELAMAFAGRAIRLAEKRGQAMTAAHGRIVRGIALAGAGRTAEAEAEFELAKSASPYLAELNLAALRGAGATTRPTTRPAREVEKIADLSADTDEAIKEPPYRSAQITSVKLDEPDMLIKLKQEEHWRAMLVESTAGRVMTIATAGDFTGKTSRGIGLGASLDSVVSKYGQPDQVSAARQGTYYLYDSQRLIFQIDAQRKVRGWVLYGLLGQ